MVLVIVIVILTLALVLGVIVVSFLSLVCQVVLGQIFIKVVLNLCHFSIIVTLFLRYVYVMFDCCVIFDFCVICASASFLHVIFVSFLMLVQFLHHLCVICVFCVIFASASCNLFVAFALFLRHC